jgi:23S rRNA pseudouridine1911/1915/1917 synthase
MRIKKAREKKMEEITLISEDENARADAWLSSELGRYSRSYIQKLIDNNSVTVNGENFKSNYRVKKNDIFKLHIPSPVIIDVMVEEIPLDILYEDTDILVVNKPKGMVVHPAAGNYTGTLVNALMNYCGDRLSDINGIIRPGIVHRLDKDTSGLLIVAKNNNAHQVLSSMLKKHLIKRIYHGLAKGVIREESGRVDAPVGRHPVDRKKMAVNINKGRNAVTNFTVLERFTDSSYIELSLETGRTHQIRVHMSYIGHPLIGDTVYGYRNNESHIGGQALHARRLCFNHPVTGEYMEFEAALPTYFADLLEYLRNPL